jgi:hypothetical protein
VRDAFGVVRVRTEKKETRSLASNSNKTKSEAEARFARAQKRAQDAVSAMSEAQSEAKRVDANTARLKALRMARDAAEAAAAKAAPPKKKSAAKKKTAKTPKAIPVEELNASNDK